MKSITEQLARYKSVHLNSSNIKTHFVGIPLIIWAIFVGLGSLSFSIGESGANISLGVIFAVVVSIYYFKLHFGLAVAMLIFIIPVIYLADFVAHTENGLWVALIAFVIGWIFQLIGHKHEKAKPAFIDDINQLLIGPLFLMAEICFVFGRLKQMNENVTRQAIEFRKQLEASKR
ncbi:DUF962 domain-containing protein [Parashewanella spongiae]|uniref:DUF962 domain-containing protein n=1 Tax=Parashewanella spongiae TaxID=342950 RepID=A0A3A6TBN2_9GAMM|nr:Mpo1-like protein [Parashewanella spongiae]MCL1080185.1 DUF962 domain-containing protein [Parashewanella spongiae]RJY02438.1 DUF962 domain-containing protein [Parashewanella spongiae]